MKYNLNISEQEYKERYAKYDEYNEKLFFEMYNTVKKTGIMPDYKYNDIMMVRFYDMLAIHTVFAKGLQIPFGRIKNFVPMKALDEIAEYGAYVFPYSNGTIKDYYEKSGLSLPKGFSWNDKAGWNWVILCNYAGLDPATFGF